MRYIKIRFCGISAVWFCFCAVYAETPPAVYTFTTDTGYYFATSHEGKMNASSDLMSLETIQNIPYTLGDWRGYELEHDDKNIVFFRAYDHAEDEAKIYFIAVHGMVESTFHTPEVCYINDNWKVKKRGFVTVPSGKKSFETRYFVAQKNDWQHYMMYFFMWHDSRRLMNKGCVMFRIAVRITDDEENAQEYGLDFIRSLSSFSGTGEISDSAGVVVTPAVKAVSPASAFPNPSSPYYDVRKKTFGWLVNQTVPNQVVPVPANDRRNLILSYELPETAEAYRYIFSKSSLYDNGVAVIAFCIERQFEQAGRIIDAIMRMGGEDGELFFTFNTHNTWPSKDDHWGAIIRSGASAWAGQAIAFFLRAQLHENPDAITQSTELTSYMRYAETIADNMLKRMIDDEQDARYGLITGGKGSYVLTFNQEIDKVEEKFVPGEVTWCSVEHNIDMYFFLRDLGIVTGKAKYKEAADRMGRRLIVQTWNEQEGQFNRGQSIEQEDTVMALDCASWGALLLLSRDKDDLADKALLSTEKYISRMSTGFGYKPYVKKLVYERYDAGKYYFPENPRKTWDDVTMMWTEGALGVALAYIRAGNKEKGKEIIDEVLKFRSSSNGIYYSSFYVPHEFSKEPAVAPAGWLLIVLGALEDNPIAQLFWD